MKRDIVVIGASAGGVEALKSLVANLPGDLEAAVFVVLHLPAGGRSLLAEILDRAGPLPAAPARDGEVIRHRRIYVAPPDHHLLLYPQGVHLSRGPRENLARPSVDALFRSAARAFGPRVVGVVLTGQLNDGIAGLVAVKRRGGATVVQDPSTAQFPSMPQSAVDFIDVDHCVPLEAMAPLLSRLVRETVQERPPPAPPEQRLETRIAAMPENPFDEEEYARLGSPSPFSCPECRGVLWSVDDPKVERYRCRVGHAYTAEALYTAQEDEMESAVWAALRSLEESDSLAQRLARTSRERRDEDAVTRFEERCRELRRYIRILRRMLAASPRGHQGPAQPP